MTSHLANAGIYICQPEILDWVPKNQFVDFGHDTFPALLAANQPLYGYEMEEYLIDIGSPATYAKVQDDVVRLGLV